MTDQEKLKVARDMIEEVLYSSLSKKQKAIYNQPCWICGQAKGRHHPLCGKRRELE